MIEGETVTVISYTEGGYDELGAAIKQSIEKAVANVVVFPGASKDASEDIRPDGVVVAYTLHFPKTFKDDIMGCDVIVRGHKCHVIGHPDRMPTPPCPTKWNMTVEVSYVEG